MENNIFDKLIAAALEGGAYRASIIKTDLIATDRAFRDMCASNACGVYGKCWMCPPEIGEITELMAEISTYDYALVYQLIGTLEDSFDFEGMMEAGKHHNLCSQAIRRKLEGILPEHLHLTGGGCHLCERCSKLDDLPCRHPKEALTSLEGYGIDVYRTSQATDLKYINGTDTVTYFGIILFS